MCRSWSCLLTALPFTLLEQRWHRAWCRVVLCGAVIQTQWWWWWRQWQWQYRLRLVMTCSEVMFWSTSRQTGSSDPCCGISISPSGQPNSEGNPVGMCSGAYHTPRLASPINCVAVGVLYLFWPRLRVPNVVNRRHELFLRSLTRASTGMTLAGSRRPATR